jgi:hypothetical protein
MCHRFPSGGSYKKAIIFNLLMVSVKYIMEFNVVSKSITDINVVLLFPDCLRCHFLQDTWIEGN